MNNEQLRKELATVLLQCHLEHRSVREQVIFVMNVLGRNGILKGDEK